MTQHAEAKAAETAIKAKFAQFDALVASGAPAMALAEAMYWPDLVVTGEGFDKVYRSLRDVAEIASSFEEILGRDAHWTLSEPLLVSGDLASAYTQVTCNYEDKPPYFMRILYIFHRREDQWKVVHEMLCTGLMH